MPAFSPAALCEASRSQLVVIDIQERLSSVMPATALQRLTTKTGILLDVAARLHIPVAITEQYPKGLGPTVADVRTRLPADSFASSKTCFSSCGAEGFSGFLARQGRPQIILAGMETHVCVLQTAIELMQQGYQVFVVEDAVCSRFDTDHRTALARLSAAGVIITCMESVIFEWLKDSRHAEFKAMTAVLKDRTG